MRWPVWLLSVALSAAAATSWWLWQELRAEQARNLELHSQLAKAAAIAAPVHPHPVDAAAANSPAPASAPTTVTPAIPVAMASTEQRPQNMFRDYEEHRARQQRLLADPGYREAWRAQSRLTFGPRRANLIRLIGLTPEAADAVIEATIDQQMLSQHRQPPQSSDDEQRMKWQAQVAAENDAAEAKIRSLIGEDKYPRYEEYMESRRTRMQVDRLRSELTEMEALRDDQVEPLIAALHAAETQTRQEQPNLTSAFAGQPDVATIGRNNEFQAKQLKVTHERMRAAASGILTGAQLAKLDQMFSVEQQRQEAHQAMQRAQVKLKSPEKDVNR